MKKVLVVEDDTLNMELVAEKETCNSSNCLCDEGG